MIAGNIDALKTHMEAGVYSTPVNWQKNYIPVVDEHDVQVNHQGYIFAQNIMVEINARCNWKRSHIIQMALLSWADPADLTTAAEAHLTSLEEVLDQLETFAGAYTLTEVKLDEVYNPEDVHSRAVFSTYIELEFIA